VAKRLSAASEVDVASWLGTIGYDTAQLHEAVRAFQRRYYPENITGNADSETATRLEGLALAVSSCED
jgi:N-acetyl-anhydromuramyl-L-alanine amidase AmpD